MILEHETLPYNSLEELQATYKPNNPDILRLKAKYGDNVSFSRVTYPVWRVPRHELRCYTIVKKGD